LDCAHKKMSCVFLFLFNKGDNLSIYQHLKLFSCFKGIANETQKIEEILKDVHLLEHQSKLSKELR
jgi:ABC-type multidrug transport system ATPase subunit